MKEGWEYSTIGDLCDKMNGLWKGKTGPFVNVGVIRNANFTKSFTLSFDNIEYLDVEAKQYKTRKLVKGDLIVEKSGGSEKQPVGRTVLFEKEEGEYSFSNFTSVLRIKDRNIITPEFLYKYILFVYLRGDTRKMQKATTGIHNIEFDKFLAIPVPTLSLSKQQSIVNYLDSAFAKIDTMKANAEKALNEAKALFQASLKEMLEPKEGWEVKTLGEMSEIQSGFAFKSTQFQKRGEFQVIRMGNVRPGIIRYNESPVFIDSVDKNTIEKALLKVGDMIITQTGSRNKRDYGFTVLIDKEKLLLNQRIARIRVINTITNKYLLYYSWTDYFRDQYFANEGGTVGQGNVGIDAIRYAVIPYPPFSEQQTIVDILDSLKSKVDRLQANYDKISQECDALKQAILRQVFE